MMIMSLGAIVTGCVAQQADVVRIKRELDAKIRQLDKSKTSLQQAVTDANTSLNKANTLIARQREEIQELLQARAEVMDQVATLKDTDLSQVRGAVEQNQHLVSELDQKISRLDTKVQSVETSVQHSHDALEPLVQELRQQVSAEEELLTAQGGKLGEFRTSMVDYQQVLTELQQSVAQQDKQMAKLNQDVNQLGQQQNTKFQQVQMDVKDVRGHIQSVIGTLEQISATFSGRLDAYEQQRSLVSQRTTPGSSVSSQGLSMPPLSFQTRNSSQAGSSKAIASSAKQNQEVVFGSRRSVNEGVSGARVAYAAQPPLRERPTIPIQKKIQDDRAAYHEAFTLLRAKNYGGAASSFSEFLRTYPDSSLAGNSQYWLGECYYGQRRFQEAIDEYERVFRFFPSSNKVPASLLKIGYAHLELKHHSIARSVFQQLVRSHPQSSEAIKAHGRLREVNALLRNPS